MTLDKTMTEAEVVSRLESGMTIGVGGWGARRKPMSIIRELVRSDITDLTVASYGGPDVGLLCAAGKVRQLICPFVSLDSIPLEPHFRKARQSGTVADRPMDEGQFLLALQAAAWRVPFLPTRVGLGSDLFRDDPSLRTVTSPYADDSGEFEELVAVPALHLDAALIHMNRGDRLGNAQFLGPDPYFDDLMTEAATHSYLSVEQLVDTAEFPTLGSMHTMRVNRLFITGVVEAPNGAHFTSCVPDYECDEAFMKQYAASAKSPEAWAEFRSTWLDCDEAEYQRRVAALQEDA